MEIKRFTLVTLMSAILFGGFSETAIAQSDFQQKELLKAKALKQNRNALKERFDALSLTGHCTAVTRRSSRNPLASRPNPIAMERYYQTVCLASSGDWIPIGPPIHRDPQCVTADVFTTPIEVYGHAKMFRDPQNQIFVGLHVCPRMDNERFIIQRLNFATFTWETVSNLDNLGEDGYTQFGPEFASLFNLHITFWSKISNTTQNPGRVSVRGALSSDITFGDQTYLIRHPSFLFDGGAYFYYGEPAPTVYQAISATQVQSLGSVSLNQNEKSLHSSLAVKNGEHYFAYSVSYPDPQVANPQTPLPWHETAAKTQVAKRLANGTWQKYTDSFEETTGRDQTSPFIADIGGDLVVFAPDYTTEGLPEDAQSDFELRYRTKKLNANGAWDDFGAESLPVLGSQRHEFLKNGNEVLFLTLQKKQTNPRAKRAIVWKNGDFAPLGNVIEEDFVSRYRPGSILFFL